VIRVNKQDIGFRGWDLDFNLVSVLVGECVGVFKKPTNGLTDQQSNNLSICVLLSLRSLCLCVRRNL
jgi:hypothetical protein